jgi:hypothetical protein
VSHLGILVAAEFYADFVLVNGGDDYISKVYDYAIAMVGTYSLTSFGINKAREDISGPAYATLEWEGTTLENLFTTTFRLRLYVGNDGYYSLANY